jgi:hypothetical protein
VKITAKYLTVALIVLLSVGVLSTLTISISREVKSSVYQNSLEIVRRDLENRITLGEKTNDKRFNDLSYKLDSDAYVNKRRLDLLEKEIELLREEIRILKGRKGI